MSWKPRGHCPAEARCKDRKGKKPVMSFNADDRHELNGPCFSKSRGRLIMGGSTAQPHREAHWSPSRDASSQEETKRRWKRWTSGKLDSKSITFRSNYEVRAHSTFPDSVRRPAPARNAAEWEERQSEMLWCFDTPGTAGERRTRSPFAPYGQRGPGRRLVRGNTIGPVWRGSASPSGGSWLWSLQKADPKEGLTYGGGTGRDDLLKNSRETRWQFRGSFGVLCAGAPLGRKVNSARVHPAGRFFEVRDAAGGDAPRFRSGLVLARPRGPTDRLSGFLSRSHRPERRPLGIQKRSTPIARTKVAGGLLPASTGDVALVTQGGPRGLSKTEKSDFSPLLARRTSLPSTFPLSKKEGG